MAENKGKVLVADDDADARAIVTFGVEELGFEVIQAKDGNEAVELFHQHSPILAVVDMMMPGRNGSEVCQEIKASGTGTLVPVLMLTACDTLQEKITALEGGVDEYLTKPFHLEELQARIKALLRIRDLTLRLVEKNEELTTLQQKLIDHERRSVVNQLAGTAAHQLGQPLSAIMLNCHLLDRLPLGDERSVKALQAIKHDAKRMAELIEKLKSANPDQTAHYHGKDAILDIDATDAKKKS